MIDSRNATTISGDGSTAIFNLSQGVSASTETTTALVSLIHFHAGNTIYNIDSTKNKIEFLIQKCTDNTYMHL